MDLYALRRCLSKKIKERIREGYWKSFSHENSLIKYQIIYDQDGYVQNKMIFYAHGLLDQTQYFNWEGEIIEGEEKDFTYALEALEELRQAFYQQHQIDIYDARQVNMANKISVSETGKIFYILYLYETPGILQTQESREKLDQFKKWHKENNIEINGFLIGMLVDGDSYETIYKHPRAGFYGRHWENIYFLYYIHTYNLPRYREMSEDQKKRWYIHYHGHDQYEKNFKERIERERYKEWEPNEDYISF